LLGGALIYILNYAKKNDILLPNKDKLEQTTDRIHTLMIEIDKPVLSDDRIQPAKNQSSDEEEYRALFYVYLFSFRFRLFLFLKCAKYAYRKAVEWSSGDNKNEEFKRVGAVLMAALAVHDRKEKDSIFLRFLLIIY
jgi:hypothetical protein